MLVFIIYLADVLPSIGNIFQAIAIVTGVVMALYICGLLIGIGSAGESCDFTLQSNRRESLKNWISSFKNGAARNGCLVIVFSALISAAMPSKTTMYLMAAAYYGEQVVTSQQFQDATSDVISETSKAASRTGETASKAHQALNAWLTSYIEKHKPGELDEGADKADTNIETKESSGDK